MAKSANTAIRFDEDIIEKWREMNPTYASWTVTKIFDFVMRQAVGGSPTDLINNGK